MIKAIGAKRPAEPLHSTAGAAGSGAASGTATGAAAAEALAVERLPVRLIPFQGLVPERFASFFGRLTPWTWCDLRTVFCRHPESKRLVNILRTVDLILEKAPYTLARGHWSISGYRHAKGKLEEAIARLGALADLTAGDARVRQGVPVPDWSP